MKPSVAERVRDGPRGSATPILHKIVELAFEVAHRLADVNQLGRALTQDSNLRLSWEMRDKSI